MTAPPAARERGLDEAPVGEVLFRSWVLLFGLLPVERMDLVIEALEPGRRFVEASRVLVLRAWRHERTVEPDGPDACVVTDRLTPAPRLALLGPLVRAFVALFFDHRHRRLRRLFGGVPLPRAEA
jgi:hypothetical protein